MGTYVLYLGLSQSQTCKAITPSSWLCRECTRLMPDGASLRLQDDQPGKNRFVERFRARSVCQAGSRQKMAKKLEKELRITGSEPKRKELNFEPGPRPCTGVRSPPP